MNRPLEPVRIVCLVVAALAAGCLDREVAGVDPVVQTMTVLTGIAPPSGKVDILVVVDDSGSMSEEQTALAVHFPGLIQELMDPSDPAMNAVTDLNVGIVSTDLGSAGFVVSSCGNGTFGYAAGDDGCFRNTPPPGAAGCPGTYPSFLHRDASNSDAYPLERMGRDFACLATLGTDGCGFEQQLAAARRALVDQTGAGGCNAGFLRPDSILAVLWVSDEEDGSIGEPTVVDPARTDLGCLNLRTIFHPEMLVPVADMIDALRNLRDDPQRFVVGMIVGVPMVDACQGRGDMLDECLDRPEMQYAVVPGGGCELEPSCTSPSGWGVAYPPRRFVEAARMLGRQATVHSICADDWRPAVHGVLDLIQGSLKSVCFPHELVLDPRTCRAECNVVEVLSDDRECPAGRTEAVPATETDPRGVAHRRCVIPQAERTPGADGACPATARSGWYYVPRAQSGDAGCDEVLFAPDAQPAPLSRAQLECLSYVCPAERRCGAVSSPGGRCCGEDEACVDYDPLAGGRCVAR